MKKCIVRLLLPLLAVILCAPCFAAQELDAVLNDTARCLVADVREPTVGSIGGEWTVLGLARGGAEVPEGYYQCYYDTLLQVVKERGGVLHEKKYTEYSRVILALGALGADARNTAGYDLCAPLSDVDATVWQGINGAIYALLALDSCEGTDAALKQCYVNYILSVQLPDGGWCLTGDSADADVTGAALQALAKYRAQPETAQAIERALSCMSARQLPDGGFATYGVANAESCAQMLTALGELGVAADDKRFVKNGNTVLDALLRYYLPEKGFRHASGDAGASLMATEQAFYALVSARRAREGQSSLYRMDDVPALVEESVPLFGLPGRHADVSAPRIVAAGKSFPDISGHEAKEAIEALAQRGVISGTDTGLFEPERTMTRAEFCTVVVKALGLPTGKTESFSDVPTGVWFAPYVGAASGYGIVNGTGEGKFSPYGVISRQEAACMLARAAALCGMDTTISDAQTRNVLAQFGDYVTSASWARGALAFCYREDILDQSALDIRPHEHVTRGEIAAMLYALVGRAALL